jgi:hypothetical protein
VVDPSADPSAYFLHSIVLTVRHVGQGGEREGEERKRSEEKAQVKGKNHEGRGNGKKGFGTDGGSVAGDEEIKR